MEVAQQVLRICFDPFVVRFLLIVCCDIGTSTYPTLQVRFDTNMALCRKLCLAHKSKWESPGVPSPVQWGMIGFAMAMCDGKETTL
jgi:hypothetical protein